ncbi:MAG: hypothetical protein ACR2PS_16530, partial [Pseudomonadales bacterium]
MNKWLLIFSNSVLLANIAYADAVADRKGSLGVEKGCVKYAHTGMIKGNSKECWIQWGWQKATFEDLTQFGGVKTKRFKYQDGTDIYVYDYGTKKCTLAQVDSALTGADPNAITQAMGQQETGTDTILEHQCTRKVAMGGVSEICQTETGVALLNKAGGNSMVQRATSYTPGVVSQADMAFPAEVDKAK